MTSLGWRRLAGQSPLVVGWALVCLSLVLPWWHVRAEVGGEESEDERVNLWQGSESRFLPVTRWLFLAVAALGILLPLWVWTELRASAAWLRLLQGGTAFGLATFAALLAYVGIPRAADEGLAFFDEQTIVLVYGGIGIPLTLRTFAGFGWYLVLVGGALVPLVQAVRLARNPNYATPQIVAAVRVT